MITFGILEWVGEPRNIRRIMNKIVRAVSFNISSEIRRACAILFSFLSPLSFIFCQSVGTEWIDKSERIGEEKGNVHQGELCLQQQ